MKNVSSFLGIAQSASKILRKQPGCFNRLFTPPYRLYARRADNDAIRELTDLLRLFGRADAKSHAHRRGCVLPYTLNQIAKVV